jgi:putative ABC transport system permease protein
MRYHRRFLFFASTIAIGIGFLFSINNLLSTINRGIALQSRQFLTADVALSSWRPLSSDAERVLAELEKRGHRIGRMLQFVSMLGSAAPNSAPILVNVKAVDSTYPIYGKWEVVPAEAPQHLRQAAVCLIARELAEQRGLATGNNIVIGGLSLNIAGIIDREPDQIFSLGGIAPSVVMPYRLAHQTDLIRFGSRVNYRALIALSETLRGEPQAANALKQQLTQSLDDPYLQITSYDEAQPQIREALQRMASFFILAATVALFLGAIGMAAGVSTFLNEQLSNVGILRCLGFGPTDISRLYLRLCVGIGLLGGVGGIAVGYLLSLGGSLLLQKLLGIALPLHIDLGLLAEGLVLALLLAVGLNYAAIRILARLSPQAILRWEISEIRISRLGLVLTVVTLLLGLFLYTFKHSQSLLVAGFFSASMLGATLICLSLILGILGLLKLLSLFVRSNNRLSFALRHGLLQLLRQRSRSLTFLLALSIGFSLIGHLRIVQYSVVQEISMGRSGKLPDLFLIDIQSDQVSGIGDLLKSHKATKSELEPMIRGRLTHINRKPIVSQDLKAMTMEGRSRARFLAREQNITHKDLLNPTESITTGKFWQPGETRPLLSLEARFAQRIGVKIGDLLSFDIAGRSISATVTSLRSIDWMNLRPNFFIVLPTGFLQHAPQTWIGSVSMPAQEIRPFQAAMLKQFPNVSNIQIAPIVSRVRDLLLYFIAALQFLAGVCIAVGLLILAGTLHSGRHERQRKAALMRTLGCEHRSIRNIDTIEFLLIGLISGFIAVSVSWSLSYILAIFMNIRMYYSPMLLLELMFAVVLLPLAIGIFTNRRIHRASVMENLRQSQG